MEIVLGAKVDCSDGACGQTVYVLINPVTNMVTHLVVREDDTHSEYIVPVDIVTDTTPERIILKCSKAQLEIMEPFIKTHFVEEKMPGEFYYAGNGTYGPNTFYYFPYVTPEITVQLPVEEKQIPPDELAVRRGANVEATDGRVGRVDEFVVDPDHGSITHLVMREGHMWGQKDVILPASAIAEIHEDTVVLKLDKQQIESLPSFPIHRHWL